MAQDQHSEYEKITLDNAVCKRRFHLVYDEKSPQRERVVVHCPHCLVTLFEHDNHAPVVLAREENLVKAPTGEVPVLTECKFIVK